MFANCASVSSSPPIAQITPDELIASFALYRPNVVFDNLVQCRGVDSTNVYFTCDELPGTYFIYLRKSRAWTTKIY